MHMKNLLIPPACLSPRRESVHMKNLLSKYGEVVLAQIIKRMKEREATMDD